LSSFTYFLLLLDTLALAFQAMRTSGLPKLEL
jgi:hypothetical protein